MKRRISAYIKATGLSMVLGGSACSSDPSSPANPSETEPDLRDTMLLTEEFHPTCSDSSTSQKDNTALGESKDSIPYPTDTFHHKEACGLAQPDKPSAPAKSGSILPDRGNTSPKARKAGAKRPKRPQYATFPGGMEALNAYMLSNLAYPQIAIDEGIEGTVIVKFTVKADGRVAKVKVVRGVDPAIDNEALRVVRSMPLWIPGTSNKNKTYTIPIEFVLNK
ncbi:MAG: energy transducer TonB [Paludibacteraceae bacterium]|nr:energy transducer TonB [Paludibacteraceae bacterium]